MKVVILGKGLMLGNLILGAIDSGVDIAGVFRYDYTCQNPIKIFLKDLFNPDYEKTLIRQYNLRELRFKSANSEDFRKFLIKENVDLLIVGTWRERLKKETFNIPKIACVNVHPSLLPKYRGPNPYLQTILHGEKSSGLTLHLVDENYDTGAILTQKEIPINQADTSKELRERTAYQARKMISELIEAFDTTILTPIKQSEKTSSYFGNINPDIKMLDFNSQTSDEISRTVRALHPFLPTYITYKNSFFIVNPYEFEILPNLFSKAKAGDIIEKSSKNNSMTIACKDKKAIKFAGLKLYRANFLTGLFLK